MGVGYDGPMGYERKKVAAWEKYADGQWHEVRRGPADELREESLRVYARHKESVRSWAYRLGHTYHLSRENNGQVIRVMIETGGTKTERAVAALDALTGEDPESDHNAADWVLLRMVPPEVREAYERLAGSRGDGTGRASWWATA